jgi:hypothetical protein
MGAAWIGYEATLGRKRISRCETELLATTGITVSPLDIELLENGTFAYQNAPVLLLIYTPKQWGERDFRLPKFHLCNCRTWVEMKSKDRTESYVASTRVDGTFELEVYVSHGRPETVREKLSVCEHCLERLAWKGYQQTFTSERRRQAVESFAPAEFLKKNRQAMVRNKRRLKLQAGTFSLDYDGAASALKSAAGFRCQALGCGRLLAALGERRFLHVLNGAVICVRCEAKQPGQDPVKATKDYRDFMKLFGPDANRTHHL